jgi:hypothetical protein
MAAPDDLRTDPSGRVARLAGVGAIIGAVVWPIALADLGATAISAAEDDGAALGIGTLGPLAGALLLFSAALVTLERQATRELSLADLVGDLTIATATILVVSTLVLGSSVLLGPAFVLLFVGSVILGVTGSDGKRRPRWGSVLVGIGAGGLLACLLLAAMAGPGRLQDLAGTAVLCVLLYSVGWAMLGLHLVRARPLDTSLRPSP